MRRVTVMRFMVVIALLIAGVHLIARANTTDDLGRKMFFAFLGGSALSSFVTRLCVLMADAAPNEIAGGRE